MKTLFYTTFFILFCSVFCSAQGRLGDSKWQIMIEFALPHFRLQEFDDGSSYYIGISLPRAVVFYFFDANDICNTTLVFPIKKEDYASYIEFYNENYLAKDKLTWLTASNDILTEIEAYYDETLKQIGFRWFPKS